MLAACARGGARSGSRGVTPPVSRSLSSRPPSQMAWSIELCTRKQLKIKKRENQLGKGKYHENPHLKNVCGELACTEEIVKQDQALRQDLEKERSIKKERNI